MRRRKFLSRDREADIEFELAAEDAHLNELGLLDPDEPTRYGTFVERRRWRQLAAEFTPEERREIRLAILGDLRGGG